MAQPVPPQFADPLQFVTSGVSPLGLASADIDFDGKPDLAVGHEIANQITLFRNTAGWSAPPMPPYDGFEEFANSPLDLSAACADCRPNYVAFGNFDANPYYDLVVSNFKDHSIAIFYGTDPPGKFDAANPTVLATQTGYDPEGLLVADFDKNGKLDIVAAASKYLQEEERIEPAVQLFWGQSDGSFTSQLLALEGEVGDSYAIAAGFFDDLGTFGNLDLVMANALTAGTYLLLYDSQIGGYQDWTKLDTKVGWGITAGRFGPDLAWDFAFAAHNDNQVSVHYGNGTGSFPTKQLINVQSFDPAGIDSGLINLDGQIDLVTANAMQENVTVVLGLPNGQFSETVYVFDVDVDGTSNNVRPCTVMILDVNNDLKNDLITANTSHTTISVLLNTSP